jgi:hypothetical protein
MKKYLKEHINFIENILQKEKDDFDWKVLSDFNRTQIGFFQHERLVHLLITFFFGLIFFGSVMAELGMINAGNGLIFLNGGLLLVSAILLVMLGFYIGHYFILENGVQKLYRLEKEITKHCRKIALE